jgi:hypothetical protein
MAPYQHALPLLPGLHREDHVHNIVASVVAAHIAGRAEPGLTGRSSGHEELLRTRMAELLSTVPGSLGRLQLDRCNAAILARAVPEALVADQELGVLVKQNGVVLVLE